MKEFVVGISSVILGIVILFFTFAGIILVLGLLWSIPTMLLWDWLMPELFGLKTITIWEAWGLNVLAGILFKNNGTTNKNKDSEPKKKKILFG